MEPPCCACTALSLPDASSPPSVQLQVVFVALKAATSSAFCCGTKPKRHSEASRSFSIELLDSISCQIHSCLSLSLSIPPDSHGQLTAPQSLPAPIPSTSGCHATRHTTKSRYGTAMEGCRTHAVRRAAAQGAVRDRSSNRPFPTCVPDRLRPAPL